jgi:hypothetical protein
MDQATEPGTLEVVETLDGSAAIAAFNRSEIDVQIQTAKRWPRSLKRVLENVRTLATLDEETAGTMFYALPRGGKTLEGPSIRFAEVVASSWTNLRYGGRVVAIDDKHVTAQGGAFDLENNLAVTLEAKRRITDRRGRRYDDDMITTTSQAAISIALRNAIFRVVPFALVKGIYEQARQASIGKERTIQQRRTMALEVYAKWGAKPEDVCLIAGVKGVEELDDEALIRLRGLVNAIRENETTYDQIIRNAKDKPNVIEVEGLRASDIAGGAATGRDEEAHAGQPVGGRVSAPAAIEPEISAPAVEAPMAPSRPTVAVSAPADPAGIKSRLDEINREVTARGVKPSLLEELYQKHLGTTIATEAPATTDTWVALGRVLQAVRTQSPRKG